MNTYLILLCLLSEAVSVNVVARGDNRVDFNGDASYACTLADPTGVLQVTWQRLFKDDSVENLATYSKRFGAQIIDPHRDKVVFTEASLDSTSITVKNVTWADEACYICSFNVYPSGSRRKQTCLTVQDDKRTSLWAVGIPVILIISFLVICGIVMLQKKKGYRLAALATTADEQDPVGGKCVNVCLC
ncbi:unnamed protein product [Coregonus sp. 'balchen']|nr:unnamed protein product [Coregonus sp. 'balchen']